MNLKPGDRVVDQESGDVGVVTRKHESESRAWWVLWEDGIEAGQELYVCETDVTIEGTEDSPAEARLKALQPLLDEIDRRADKIGTEHGFEVFIDAEMWEQIKDAL